MCVCVCCECVCVSVCVCVYVHANIIMVHMLLPLSKPTSSHYTTTKACPTLLWNEASYILADIVLRHNYVYPHKYLFLRINEIRNDFWAITLVLSVCM